MNGSFPDLPRILKSWRTYISLAVGFGLLLVLFRGAGISPIEALRALGGANPGLFLLAVAVYYTTFPLRGIRWRVILGNLVGPDPKPLPGPWHLAVVILASWFANCLLPAKLGDLYRAYHLKRNGASGFSEAAGTVLIERLLDLVVVVSALAASAVFLIGSVSRRTLAEVGGLGILLLIVGLAGVGLFFRLGPGIRRRLPARLADIYLRLEYGTRAGFKRLPLTLALTAAVWACEVGRLALVTQALGLKIVPPMIVFAALANSVLTTVPFTPGGLGLVELGVAGLLSLAVPLDLAVTVALADRLISYWSLILSGLPAYILSGRLETTREVAADAGNSP
ncbi:MAG: TIGR00374 family protein [Chloroflexota bacterium]|mgnify:FL=1